MLARAMVTEPSSSGWRSSSTTLRATPAARPGTAVRRAPSSLRLATSSRHHAANPGMAGREVATVKSGDLACQIGFRLANRDGMVSPTARRAGRQFWYLPEPEWPDAAMCKLKNDRHWNRRGGNASRRIAPNTSAWLPSGNHAICRAAVASSGMDRAHFWPVAFLSMWVLTRSHRSLKIRLSCTYHSIKRAAALDGHPQ